MSENKQKTGRFIPYIQAIPDFVRYHFISGFILLLIANILEYAFNMLLSSAGKVAITSSDVLFLISSPQGILLIIIAFILAVFYCIVELNGLIIMSDKFMKGEQIKVFVILKEALFACKKFFNPKSLLLIIYIAILAPIVEVSISISLTRYFYIPTFISSVINDNNLYYVFFTIVITLLTLLYFFYSFTMHGVILDDLSFNDALKNSRELVSKNWKNYIWQHIHYLLIEGILLGITFILIIILPIVIYYRSVDTQRARFWVIFIMTMGAIIITTASLYLTPFYILKLTRLYRSYQSNQKVLLPIRKARVPFFVFTNLFVIITFSFLVAYVGNLNFDKIFAKTHKVNVIAHRGGGNEGIENTISGLNIAYSLNAYGSEIDVQRTKDDHYIINHDANFSRLAGVNKKPIDMTLEEIKQLDISGEKVATIEEMLDASHNKLILFVELKGETADNKMADDLIKMVKDKSMEDEVVFISLKYDLIDYIEDNYDDIQTAYLTFISFGDIASLNCDYIGLEEESATVSNIDRIHNNNKKVLVWTINSEKSQRHFLLSDVDGIITDNIKQANSIKTKLEERDDLIRIVDFIIELLR